jgi:hypothetical protein
MYDIVCKLYSVLFDKIRRINYCTARLHLMIGAMNKSQDSRLGLHFEILHNIYDEYYAIFQN